MTVEILPRLGQDIAHTGLQVTPSSSHSYPTHSSGREGDALAANSQHPQR